MTFVSKGIIIVVAIWRFNHFPLLSLERPVNLGVSRPLNTIKPGKYENSISIRPTNFKMNLIDFTLIRGRTSGRESRLSSSEQTTTFTSRHSFIH